MVAALGFFGLGDGLVCPTSEVARNMIAHNFDADFITLSSFWIQFVQSFPNLGD
jgi:hypothetical protein